MRGYNIVLFGLEISYFHISVVYGLDNRNNYSADTKELTRLKSCKSCKVNSVEPVNICTGIALICKGVIFLFVLHLRKRLSNGFGCLVREPQADKFFILLEGVGYAKANNYFTLAVCVSCVYNSINICAVAKILNCVKLLFNTRVNLLVLSLFKIELEFLWEAGNIVHRPLGVICGRIVLDICKREEMTENPGNDVVATLVVSVFLCKLTALHLGNACHNVSCKGGLLRNYKIHSRSPFSIILIKCAYTFILTYNSA